MLLLAAQPASCQEKGDKDVYAYTAVDVQLFAENRPSEW